MKVFLLLICPILCFSFNLRKDPIDLGKATIEEYLNFYNYPLETHKINTTDGYILSYHRIQAKNTQIAQGKPVVYLQHGLLDSSFNFLSNTEDTAPGLILANQGFDVWLGNSRGNHFSLEHQTLDWKKDNTYWQFSWQDMSEKDLPAAFQYIWNITGQKINYIGHSQGTTIMFAALAEKNEIIRKYLKSFFALGPVGFITNIEIDFEWVLRSFNLKRIFDFLNVNYILMPNYKEETFVEFVCKYTPFICSYINKGMANFEPQTDNLQRFPVIMGHYPDATSTRVLEHWQQMFLNKNQTEIKKFDYGNEILNMKAYGQKTPPAYNLQNIDEKVHLIVGLYDKIADLKDSQLLAQNLKNNTFQTIEGGHGTFMWANNATYFYEMVVQVLKNEYN